MIKINNKLQYKTKFLFPYRQLRFLSNYLRSLISTLKSKISKIKLLVVRCSNSMHYVVLLMIFTKIKICTKSAVDHKLTEAQRV
jgi:ribosomal protein S3AE